MNCFVKRHQELPSHDRANNFDVSAIVSSVNVLREICEIPPQDITIEHLMDTGNFGNVFNGQYHDPHGISIPVVIKRSSDSESAKEFLNELEILAAIGKHPYMVNLVGVITRNISKGIIGVLEHCETSLKKFLDDWRSNFVNELSDYIPPDRLPFPKCPQPRRLNRSYVELRQSDDERCKTTFKTSDLTLWACQIACAMQYLASKKIVVENLTLDSIYVFRENPQHFRKIKISGSVFSKRRGKSRGAYYLAPEIERRASVEQSLSLAENANIWAYGVLIWNMFKRIENSHSEELLKTSIKFDFPKPIFASSKLYVIMLTCWNTNPISRPRFHQLARKLYDHLPIDVQTTIYLPLPSEGANRKLSSISSIQVGTLASETETLINDFDAVESSRNKKMKLCHCSLS